MTERPTAVVSGFGPFGPHRVNPSWSAVEHLRETGVPGVRLVTEQLPVSFTRATTRIRALVADHAPARSRRRRTGCGRRASPPSCR